MEIKNEIVHPLFMLFRKSLDMTCIPEDWKCVNVTPIYKKGHRNLAENYRPVSLTRQICKMFESILRDALVHHLERKCLIKDSKHGFRKGRSCSTNLLTFLQRAQCSHCKRCISYSNSVCLSVRPSVRPSITR